ncbi:hypothetical protein E3U43_019070 [Larimichthys crocea]|uniref:Uncharacterized protein n=1 Tax=Larimichthys crocea TaxID=215358 RepID=A0ACD3QXT8_LARCR|nr:hypothetical protein E3U43_019070 [Larimichthys crocea]
MVDRVALLLLAVAASVLAAESQAGARRGEWSSKMAAVHCSIYRGSGRQTGAFTVTAASFMMR